MLDTLTDLDAPGLLAASTAAVRARRLAEVADLEVLAQWACLHGADPTVGPDGAICAAGAQRAGRGGRGGHPAGAGLLPR